MNKLSKKSMAQIINKHLENGFNGTLTELQDSLIELDNFIKDDTQAKELVSDLGTYKMLNRILDFDFEIYSNIMTDMLDIKEVANKIAFINAYEILANSEIFMETWLEEINNDNRQDFINEFTKKYII